MKGFKVSSSDAEVSIGVKKGNDQLLSQVNKVLAGISTSERNKLMKEAVQQQPQTSTKKENWLVSMLKNYGR